jgi:alpha-L-fucosidase
MKFLLSALKTAGVTLVLFVAIAARAATDAPRPIAPLPTPEQLAWQEGELAMFLRFGLNTFTGEEQGTGKEDPKLFNPAKLDVRQWVKLAKE